MTLSPKIDRFVVTQKMCELTFPDDDWGVQSPPKNKVFRFHDHSQKVIGSQRQAAAVRKSKFPPSVWHRMLCQSKQLYIWSQVKTDSIKPGSPTFAESTLIFKKIWVLIDIHPGFNKPSLGFRDEIPRWKKTTGFHATEYSVNRWWLKLVVTFLGKKTIEKP